MVGVRALLPGEKAQAAASVTSAACVRSAGLLWPLGLSGRRGLILCAVEHQGTGHHQGHAFARDAVKREALRKAGVRVVETDSDVTEEALLRTISDLLGDAARSRNNRGVEQTARP